MDKLTLVMIISLCICSCRPETCLDKAPILSCTADNYVGEWEFLGYSDIISDRCLSSLEKEVGEYEETLIIWQGESIDSLETIVVEGPLLTDRYLISNCEGADIKNTKLNLGSSVADWIFHNEDKLTLISEDILETKSKFLFISTKRLYRRKR